MIAQEAPGERRLAWDSKFHLKPPPGLGQRRRLGSHDYLHDTRVWMAGGERFAIDAD